MSTSTTVTNCCTSMPTLGTTDAIEEFDVERVGVSVDGRSGNVVTAADAGRVDGVGGDACRARDAAAAIAGVGDATRVRASVASVALVEAVTSVANAMERIVASVRSLEAVDAVSSAQGGQVEGAFTAAATSDTS